MLKDIRRNSLHIKRYHFFSLNIFRPINGCQRIAEIELQQNHLWFIKRNRSTLRRVHDVINIELEFMYSNNGDRFLINLYITNENSMNLTIFSKLELILFFRFCLAQNFIGIGWMFAYSKETYALTDSTEEQLE